MMVKHTLKKIPLVPCKRDAHTTAYVYICTYLTKYLRSSLLLFFFLLSFLFRFICTTSTCPFVILSVNYKNEREAT